MPDLVATARAALDTRSFDRGGSRVTHAYSSRIFCECGAPLNHRQSTRNGRPWGQAKYRCSRGRRGIAGETRCEFGAFGYDETNVSVEAAVGALGDPDGVLVTTGGDVERQARLDALAKQIDQASAVRDYARARELQDQYAELEAQPAQAVVTTLRLTGRTIGQWFSDSDMDARREMLVSGQFKVYMTPSGAQVTYETDESGEAA
jgi:hypothetical protein